MAFQLAFLGAVEWSRGGGDKSNSHSRADHYWSVCEWI